MINSLNRVNKHWKTLHKKLGTAGGNFAPDPRSSVVLITPAIGIVDHVCIDTFEIPYQSTDKQLDALLKVRLTGLYLNVIDLAKEAIEKIAGLE